MNGVMVIGLVAGEHTIEDIKVDVPHRVAVQIPGHLAQRSRDLQEAIQAKKILKLSGSLPSGAVMRAGVPVQRSGAARPPAARPEVASGDQSLKTENARLFRELEDFKGRERNYLLQIEGLNTLNQGMQTTMTAMSGQLTAIQGVLEDLRKQGIHVSALPSSAAVAKVSEVDGSAPMFITSVKNEDAKVNIKVTEQESQTDISASRAALKSLRNSQK